MADRRVHGVLETIRLRIGASVGHMYNTPRISANCELGSRRPSSSRLPAPRLRGSSQLGRFGSDGRELFKERQLAGDDSQRFRVPLNRHHE